jgi:iron complex outermembrane receptor protein
VKLGFAVMERAPSDIELFMNGPHLATGRFEVGNVGMDSEKSKNIDLSLDYESESFFAGLTLFINEVDSYIYLQDETEEEHEEHEEHEDDHGGMIRADYLQKDAEFEGYELEIGTDIALNSGVLSLMFGRDEVRGKFSDGSNILRMVPTRNMFSMIYTANDIKVKLSLQDVEKQNHIGLNETSTSGHQMLDLKVTRSFQFGQNAEINVTLYGKNLLDEVARNHSSFVKDQVPLPGKNFGIRLSGKF